MVLVDCPRLAALVPPAVVARLSRLLVVSEVVVGIDPDTEEELIERIAVLIDEAVDVERLLSGVLGAAAAGLVEDVDRGVYRLLARRVVRVFRRRWRRLDSSARSRVFSQMNEGL